MTRPLVAALVVGAAVRLARVAEAPLIHPDGPAYLQLAARLRDGDVWRVLGDYYSPAYPAVVAVVSALGVPSELAGRLAATLAGVAALPLVFLVTRRLLGDPAATLAVLVAAVHPALVKAAAQVLPETLAALLVLGWVALLLGRRDPRTLVMAGLMAGAAYLTRPEAALLLPLGLVVARRAGVRALAAYAVVTMLVMAPALLSLRARTGVWQLSPREGRVTATRALGGDATLTTMVRRRPARLVQELARGGVHQVGSDAMALGPLLWIPLAAGLLAARPAAATALPLVVVVAFTLGPLALNPSRRYAVPLVPLLLPWVGVGLRDLATRLGSRAGLAGAVLSVALLVRALWVSHPFDAACNREVGQLVRERYGEGQRLVAVDGRFAYAAGGRAVVPRGNEPARALALARRKGARLWLTRPRWVRPPWQPPPGVHEVARPCAGAFILFALPETSSR